MALFYDWGFFVAPGKDDDFREWLAENDQSMLDLAPKNYEYLGTYRPLAAADPCDYHQVWRYADNRIPDLRKAAGDSGGAFTELARQYLSFVDTAREAEEKFNLYGPVAPPSHG
jgi:hypothetical protein